MPRTKAMKDVEYEWYEDPTPTLTARQCRDQIDIEEWKKIRHSMTHQAGEYTKEFVTASIDAWKKFTMQYGLHAKYHSRGLSDFLNSREK